MSKKTKLITIIVSAVLVVALLTLAVCLIVANNNREKTKTSVMTCSVNPQVQFVLNGNDKVMEVVALNEEGKGITLNAKFEGMKAEDAVTLFVTMTTEGGYLNLTGGKATITISGLKADYSKLTEKAVANINKYFDDNGIIAGAVAKVEDLKDTVKTLKSTAGNVDNESPEELLEHYTKIVNQIKDLDVSKLSEFYAKYDELYKTYTEEVKKANEAIADLEEKIKLLPEDSELRTTTEQRLQGAKKGLAAAETAYTTNVNLVKESLKASETLLNKLKEIYNTRVEETKAALNACKDNLAKDSAAVRKAIEEFRATLLVDTQD